MTKIYNAEEFREAYGKHFNASPGSARFEDTDVPASVAALIPYARFWGVEDDGDVEDLLEQIPQRLQINFQEAVYSLEDALEDWLAGPEAQSRNPTAAYVAFSAMLIAADSIQSDEDEE